MNEYLCIASWTPEISLVKIKKKNSIKSLQKFRKQCLYFMNLLEKINTLTFYRLKDILKAISVS